MGGVQRLRGKIGGTLNRTQTEGTGAERAAQGQHCYLTKGSRSDHTKYTYGKIYKGNVENGEDKAARYIRKYDRFLYKAKNASIESLTAKDLKETAMCTGDSATGLDQ